MNGFCPSASKSKLEEVMEYRTVSPSPSLALIETTRLPADQESRRTIESKFWAIGGKTLIEVIALLADWIAEVVALAARVERFVKVGSL